MSTTTLTVPDDPKMLRETLCVAQAAVARATATGGRDAEHIARLGRLIDECDRHRPLGSDGKHGSLHTVTCGCDDVVSPAVGDVITLPEYLDGLADGREVTDRHGKVWTATEHQSPTGRMWTTGGSSLSSRGLLNGGGVTLRPDAPPAAPTAGVDREALIEAISARLHITTDRIPGVTLSSGLSADTAAVGEAADAVLAHLATQPTPAPVPTGASSWDCDECGVTLTQTEVSDPAARQWLTSPGAEEPDAVRHTRCPAPVDADAVERAECAHEDAEVVPRCLNCGRSADTDPDGTVTPDEAVWIAENAAALTAARAGGGGVTAEQVDAAVRAMQQPRMHTNESGGRQRADLLAALAALGVEVQR